MVEEHPPIDNGCVRFICQSSRQLLRIRYLQSGGSTAGSGGLPWKQAVSLYIQILKGPTEKGLSILSNEEHLLSQLEDENLDKERWATEVKPILTKAFIDSGQRYAYSSALIYVWESNLVMGKSGSDQGLLYRALEVAKRIGDMQNQIRALDGLFLLARGEDVEAAIQVHEEFLKAEPEMASQGLNRQRVKANEGCKAIAYT